MNTRVKRSMGRGRSEKVRAYLGTSQDYLSRHEDEKYDFRLDHAVDQTGEQLRRPTSKTLYAECSEVHKPLAHNC